MTELTIVEFFALAVGFLTLLIGVSAVLLPQPMSKKFGIAASGPALPYVVSVGIRDVFMGVTILVLYYLNQWTAIGALSLALCLVALSDFRVVLKYGDKKISMVHLTGALGAGGYGLFLLLRNT